MSSESHLSIALPEPKATGFTVGDKMGKMGKKPEHRRDLRMVVWIGLIFMYFFAEFFRFRTCCLHLYLLVTQGYENATANLHIKHYKQKVERSILLFIFHKPLERLDL